MRRRHRLTRAREHACGGHTGAAHRGCMSRHLAPVPHAEEASPLVATVWRVGASWSAEKVALLVRHRCQLPRSVATKGDGPRGCRRMGRWSRAARCLARGLGCRSGVTGARRRGGLSVPPPCPPCLRGEPQSLLLAGGPLLAVRVNHPRAARPWPAAAGPSPQRTPPPPPRTPPRCPHPAAAAR